MKTVLIFVIATLLNITGVLAQEDFVQELFDTFANDDPTKFDEMANFTKDEFFVWRAEDRNMDESWRHYQRDRYVNFIAFAHHGLDGSEIVVDSIKIEKSAKNPLAFRASVQFHTSDKSCDVAMTFLSVKNGNYRLIPGFYPKCKALKE